jgi:hypothetical protein
MEARVQADRELAEAASKMNFEELVREIRTALVEDDEVPSWFHAHPRLQEARRQAEKELASEVDRGDS